MTARRWRAAIVLKATVRTAEIVADAAEGLVVADGIVDAAGAVDVPVAAGAIVDAAALAGDGTNFFATGLHGLDKGHDESCGLCLYQFRREVHFWLRR